MKLSFIPFRQKQLFDSHLFLYFIQLIKKSYSFANMDEIYYFYYVELQQNSCFSTMTTRLCLTLVELYYLSTLCTNIVHSILRNYSLTERAFSEVCAKQVSVELLTLLNIHTGFI